MSGTLDRSLNDSHPPIIETRDGLMLALRPVTTDDGPLLADLFAKLNSDDLRFRFLTGIKKTNALHISALLEVDHRRVEHLLAFECSSGTLIGSLMIVADEALQRAEVAIVVDRAFRGRGVGWSLLRHAAELANERGFHSMISIESRANHDALEVEQALGFEARPVDGDSSLVMVEKRFN